MADSPSPEPQNVDATRWAYILETNTEDSDPPTNWISLPQDGQLSVMCEYGSGSSPPTSLYVWHQGGSTDDVPVDGDFHTYTVGATDALVYQLASDDDSIKLVFGYSG